MTRTTTYTTLLVLILSALIGCATKAQSGALVGGAAGAGAGAIIGHQSGHAGGGALIGGAVGALGGALVGNEMDKSDERAERERQQEWRVRESGQYDRYDRRYESDRAYDAYDAPVTKRDVIYWTARGTRDEIIIDRIYQSGTVFHLTRADERDLRDEGVSPEVIRAMHDTARR